MPSANLRAKINQLRKEKGLTQAELAERTNLDIRTIQRIEAGEVEPRLPTLRALSEALDYNLLPKRSFHLPATVITGFVILLAIAIGSFYMDRPANISKPLLTSGIRMQQIDKVEAFGDSNIVILIDPGHGGKDPGFKHKSGDEEKDFTLILAKSFASVLSQAGYRPILTRGGDEFVTLIKRTTFADPTHIDLLISIHIGASSNADIRGIECYYKKNSPMSQELAESFVKTIGDVSGHLKMPQLWALHNAPPQRV